MEKKRKIEKVVTKVSLAEADALDDEYWAGKSENERLAALIELRKIFLSAGFNKKGIEKVVFRYSLYEEAD